MISTSGITYLNLVFHTIHDFLSKVSLSQDDTGWRCGFPDAGLVWMGKCVLWSWFPCYLLDLLCMEMSSPRYLYMILYMFKASSNVLEIGEWYFIALKVRIAIIKSLRVVAVNQKQSVFVFAIATVIGPFLPVLFQNPPFLNIWLTMQHH